MLKTILQVATVLLIALGAGTGSAWLALETTRSIGSVDVGAWTTFPRAGTRQADPYARARSARIGELALGQAEGVSFIADHDDAGAPLLRQCSYLIEGPVPAVRFFTLYAAGPTRRALQAPERFSAALHSQSLLWREKQQLSISLGRHAHPGNWLAVEGRGPMLLVLTLFDTPISTGARVDEIDLPRITRVGCDV
ncbi:DUF1214 domain-containing protein [Nitratireductor soli]|uniref:DUF1214 domain-containing protein n=1 Tax=Nitratireductor soli TaxID=1670619 RepID=UPI00065E0F8A|nr:DUF1214 domain-containing protein [Nitratireductor soli]